MKRIFTTVIVICMMLIASIAWSDIIHVPADYPTIQEGIDAASSGDTVQVAAGTYNEAITMKDNIIVQGAGADSTTISIPQGEEIAVSATNLTDGKIDGFTIAGEDYAIYCVSSFLTISNNIIGGWFGLGCSSSSPIISDNTFSGSNVGIDCTNSSPTIVRNTINDGIRCSNSSFPTIGGSLANANNIVGGIYGGSYHLVNNNSAVLVAEYNYWGTLDGETIDSRIYDDEESGGEYGSSEAVDYTPWTNAAHDQSLAVALSAFTAFAKEGKVFINWRTETEVGNIGFRIYRSECEDGPFLKIGWVDGAGNSAMPNDYQFLDKKVEVGKNYFYYLEDIDIAGERNKSDIIQITVISQPHPQAVIPAKFALLQNYPNPFNPETWIPYQLATDSPVMISIYNAKGQLIRTLHLGNKNAGIYVKKDKAAYWDGTDSLGENVASGVYFYTLQAGEFRATRKMIIMK